MECVVLHALSSQRDVGALLSAACGFTTPMNVFLRQIGDREPGAERTCA